MKKKPSPPLENPDNSLPASLQYSPKEDIYNKSKREQNINPDDNSAITGGNEKEDAMNEKDFEEDLSGSDLDIPGAELDDSNEEIGEEDEENNYYSLGVIITMTWKNQRSDHKNCPGVVWGSFDQQLKLHTK